MKQGNENYWKMDRKMNQNMKLKMGVKMEHTILKESRRKVKFQEKTRKMK